MRLTAVLVTALGVSGCAWNLESTYQNSTQTTAASVRERYIKESTFVWEDTILFTVDGKYVRALYPFEGYSGRTRKLDPGSHTLVIQMRFIRGYSLGPFEAYGRIRPNLEPNKSYRISTKIDDTSVSIWLEDEIDGRVSSEVVTAPFVRYSAPVGVPIFVPIGR